MNAKSSPALPIFLTTFLLTIVLLIALFIAAPAIEPTLAGPARDAGAPLLPSDTPYAIGFDDATEVADNWQFKSGVWSHDDSQSPGQYLQENADAASAISIYRRGIEDEYSVEVELQHLDGESGGLFFNAPDPDESTVADVLRYNRTEGEVEWGQVNANGSFLPVGSTTDGIPSDDEYHTLKVVVAGDGFTAFFDGTEIEASNFTRLSLAYVGVYTADGSYAFRTMSVRVAASPVATPTQDLTPSPTPTVTPDSGDLNPSDQTYVLGFNGAQSINSWLPGAGNWSYDQGYLQSNQSDADQFTYYKGRVNGDYEYEVTLSYLSGAMGGGLLFNAPNNNSLAGAMLVAFNPDSASGNGAILMWGYFDNNGAFQFVSDHLVIPAATDGVERYLKVAVASGNYSIWLENGPITKNDPPIADRIPLPHNIQVDQPYVGLYTKRSSVRFGSALVTVSGFVKPTTTPTNTSTISPTPTFTPEPTNTVTPHPNPLTPNDQEYTIGFGTTAEEPSGGLWVVLAGRGSWTTKIDSLIQVGLEAVDALNYFNRTIEGNYEYEVTFNYTTATPPPDPTPSPTVGALSEKDGGIVFNSPRHDQFAGAYIVTYDGNDSDTEAEQDILWGYFKRDTVEPEFVEIGRVTDRPVITDGITRTLTVAVAERHFSIWIDDQQIADRVQFVPSNPRVAEPVVGVYANKTMLQFTNGKVQVSEYTGVDPTPTHAPSPTLTSQTTPRPTKSSTPTPTWTPGTPTATPTPVAPSMPPTPTTTPIIINQPPPPTPLPAIMISTPTTKPATQTAIAVAAVAATATALFGQSATATQVALSATQTAAIIPTSPLPSPTTTGVTNAGAVDAGQASATAAAAQTMTVIADATMTSIAGLSQATGTPIAAAVTKPANPAMSATETAEAQSTLTATLIAGGAIPVVTATSTPTQRPIEEPLPAPAEPAAPAQLAFFARIINAVVTSTALIWLSIGLAVFIGVLGVIAGITFRSNEEERYALHESADGAGGEELDENEIDRILDELAQGNSAPLAADHPGIDGEEGGDEDGGEGDSQNRNQGDNWPTSLP